MAHVCTFCNYSTLRRDHYNKHLTTKKHLQKVHTHTVSKKKVGTERTITDYNGPKVGDSEDENKLICRFCKSRFKHLRSLNRHADKCRDRYMIIDKYDKICEDYEILKANNELLMEKYDQLMDKYDDSRDEVIDVLKTTNNGSSQGNFSFVKDKFLTTPPLKEIRESEVPQLEFLKKVLDEKNGEIELCEILQHHNLHKTTPGYFGDFFVGRYQRDDKSEQQFFNTDYSRLTYLVRDLVDDMPVWRVDNKGVILSRKIIIPILDYIRKHLEKYTQKYFDATMDKYQYEEFIERNHRLLQVMTNIDDGSLNTKILKYIASHFKFDKDIIIGKSKKMIKRKVKNKSKTKTKSKSKPLVKHKKKN